MVLSWQLPNIANHLDVTLGSYSVSYTRMASGVVMTNTSSNPSIAIGGLDSGQTYTFTVSASFITPFLQSGEDTLSRRTQRKLSVLRVS